MGRRSRELVRAIGPGAGNPTPVRGGVRVCRICSRAILPGQPALFGVHRVCLAPPKDEQDALVYRMPEGGMIRLGKPKPPPPRPPAPETSSVRHGRLSRQALRESSTSVPAATS
jgi:hypothetical protein